MSLNQPEIKNIIEAAIMAVGQPVTIERIMGLFEEDDEVKKDDIKVALEDLAADCANRGVELKEVRSGYRFQAKQDYAKWLQQLWEEKPPRYSRALLETLVLIAYRQPITRGEIEDVRGVSVSSHITKTLMERDWIRIVGHRDVPGKPGLYATTKEFLDYFNLRSLDELPTLSEIKDLDKINMELPLEGQQTQEENPQGQVEGETESDLNTTGVSSESDVSEEMIEATSSNKNSLSRQSYAISEFDDEVAAAHAKAEAANQGITSIMENRYDEDRAAPENDEPVKDTDEDAEALTSDNTDVHQLQTQDTNTLVDNDETVSGFTEPLTELDQESADDETLISSEINSRDETGPGDKTDYDNEGKLRHSDLSDGQPAAEQDTVSISTPITTTD